jgi:uncharacterized protein YktB (UPF0637 family)
MIKESSEEVLSLEQVETAAAVEGFTPEDFAVFEAPDFATRMSLLKLRLTPKLKQISLALADRMTDTLGEKVYPHVAQHLRRSVNPPVATWAAFAKNARAYKPYVHIRVAISLEQLCVLLFVEDYADEKEVFANNLGRNADALAAWFTHHPTIHAYDLETPQSEALRGHALNEGAIRAFAERLSRVKGQHARFGIPFARSHPVLQNGPEFLEAILDAAKALKPLYDCGRPDFIYEYTPEPIEGM